VAPEQSEIITLVVNGGMASVYIESRSGHWQRDAPDGRSDNRGSSTNAFGSLYSTHSDLLLHRTEVSLHPIHSHGNRIQQVQ
jgi:hypothetical protein